VITELQQLVVKLVGDGSSFMNMCKEAEEQTEQTESKIESLGVAAAGFLGALGIQDFLAEAKEEWAGAETAAFRLTAALKANGGEVEALAEDYLSFATSIQAITTASDESVAGLAKTALSYGLVGESVKTAAKDAMALGAATDVAAESALRLTAAMEAGDTERAQAMARMIPQLRGIKDETEFVAKYQKLLLAGNIALADELETFAGQEANFANQWSDTLEGIGEAYTQVANPMKLAKMAAMELWGTLDEGSQKSAVLIAGWATNITIAVTALTALNAVFPALKANLLAVAKNPFVWAAAAAVAIAQLTKEVESNTQAAKDHREALDQLERASRGYQTDIQETIDERVKNADGNRGKLEAIRADIEKQVRTAEEELERQQANRPSFFVRATSSISGAVGGPESRALERHRALTKAAKEETEAWRTQLERVNKELESIGKQRNVAAIQRAMQEAQKQTDESGKDADRLRRDNLEDKGATQEQLAELDRLVAKRKLREQLLALDKEARYAGMTDKQKALQDAADNGATQKDLDRIRQNQRRIDMQTMLAKTLEELKTPEQKLQEETSKLNQLYEEGQLTADQYAQANQKLRDSILGVAAAEQAAMKFGSQADMAERRRYFDALNLSPGTAPPPRPDFNAVQGQQAAVKQAENTELLKQVLTKLNEAGVFNLAFIGGGAG
jgi:hypothetical protein